MSVFTKIVTGIFGKKSEKDLKELSPFVDEINAAYNPLGSLSDDELINRFHTIKEEIKDLSINSRKTFKAEGLEEEDLDDAVIKAEQEFFDIIGSAKDYQSSIRFDIHEKKIVEQMCTKICKVFLFWLC